MTQPSSASTRDDDAQGFVVWLTGLPSSGKTTLGLALASLLRERGLLVEILDGDELRRSLSADLGFSAKDRKLHASRVIHLCKKLVNDGIVAIVAIISPYRDTRRTARHELHHFIEVYVKCPVDVCSRRDVKGLYVKALGGEISEFTGVSGPYEEPECPEVTVETDVFPVDRCLQLILNSVEEHGYLRLSASYRKAASGG